MDSHWWVEDGPWIDTMSSGKVVTGNMKLEKVNFGNGDGYLYYPPREEDKKNFGNDVLIPSMRLYVFRDGLEDYEYLVLLQEHIDKAKKKGIDTESWEKILGRVKEIAPSGAQYTKSPEKILEVREEVAQAIEALNCILYKNN